MKDIHKKLSESIKTMLIDSKLKLPYYGYFNSLINFHQSNISTCGVNITSRGLNFYYSSDFLDSLTQEEVNFVVIHENFHLLWDHQSRTKSLDLEHELSNIAQDMIINYIILEDIESDFAHIPKYKSGKLMGKTMGLLPPKEYDGKLIFEDLYTWLLDKKNSKRIKSDLDWGKFSKGPRGLEEGPSLDKIFRDLESNSGEWLDKHLEDEVSGELRESIIKDIKENLKSRGYQTSHNKATLSKLESKKVDYLKDIKKYYKSFISGRIKSKTISRPNRRNIFGLKGFKKIKSNINVILDVSGSMIGEFEKVLSYIYRDDIDINLIKSDTEVKGVEKLTSKKSIQNIKIVGLGGTFLQPAVDLVSSDYNNYPTVILTDGVCDVLNLSNLRYPVLILTTNVKVKLSGGNRVKQIFIK
jgi:predicted metal-dependent peptidase